MSAKTVDLTPSPRILRMLGRIEFENWQCLAEMIDNSIDAITESGVGGYIEIESPTMGEFDDQGPNAKLVVKDDGPGMSLEELEMNLKAGYSGNDPITKLGLFGMGFNIATARLGGRTKVRTTKQGDDHWRCVTIDFEEMELGDTYDRTIEREDKHDPSIHGTEIIISKLRDRVRTLHRQPKVVRKLNRIYTPIIQSGDVTIELNGDKLTGRGHCVWHESRSVERNDEEIPAYIEVERTLGEEYYCKHCWNWWEDRDIQDIDDPICPNCEGEGDVVLRKQKIKGWVGIQRFFDDTHYGIDFIRNGRVIEELDKSLFFWKNPDDEEEKEYPIDTMHWGGRIVGEIHVNFVPVTYTKDHFERHDKRWKKVRNALRGEGPLRPQIAGDYGYPENNSPIGRLFTGYRSGRNAGKKWLVPGSVNSDGSVTGINEKPKEWAEKFWEGHPKYQDDTVWWEAVEKAEEAKRDSGGEGASIDDITPGEGGDDTEDETDTEDEDSDGEGDEFETEIDSSLTQEYSLGGSGKSPIQTDVKRLRKGSLNGKPVKIEMVSHDKCKFIYDPQHALLSGFGYRPIDIILMELSNIYYQRIDDPDEWSPSRIYAQLKETYCPDDRLSPGALATRADELLKKFKTTVADREGNLEGYQIDDDVREHVREQVFKTLGQGEETVSEILDSTAYLRFAPHREVIRLLREKPNLFFDGKVWERPYSELGSESLKERCIEDFAAYIDDAIFLADEAADHDTKSMRSETRMELVRASYSLRILDQEAEAAA